MEPGRQEELFYIAPDLTLMAISVKTAGSALEAGVPVRLFKAPLSGGILRREYDVAADGRFLINVSAVDAGAPQTIPIIVTVSSATGTPAQEDRVQSR